MAFDGYTFMTDSTTIVCYDQLSWLDRVTIFWVISNIYLVKHNTPIFEVHVEALILLEV